MCTLAGLLKEEMGGSGPFDNAQASQNPFMNSSKLLKPSTLSNTLSR